MYRMLLGLLLIAAIGFAFVYGVGVGKYEWPPYSLLAGDDNGTTLPESDDPEQQLLEYAFTDELSTRQQLLPPIKTLEGIHQAVDAMALPTEWFWDVAERMSIDAVNFVQASVPNSPPRSSATLMHVQYSIEDRSFDAYAYQVRGPNVNPVAAALVMPGSGENQSSGIVSREANNYQQAIMDVFSDGVVRYVFIKPNEDCLAIHDGQRKLNRDFYSNWLLTNGASYGAHYVANSIAITKALQSRYDQVIVCGLSQGGEAALLNALQTQPDYAIVASGYSAVYQSVKWAGYNQIAIPGLQQKLPLVKMREIIQQQSTRYFFSWGKQERGTYGIEAQQKLLCKQFAGLNNVTCEIHAGGHEYPLALIEAFCADP